jgi:ribonuclease HI
MPDRIASKLPPEDFVVAYIDGGSRGNPGPSGAGVYFERDGKPWRGVYQYLGQATNNHAEYSALLRALDYARDSGFRRIAIYSDSELLVRQMSGQYRVKNPNLQELQRRASDTIRYFERHSIEHVPRERNSQADALANKAMDLRCSGEDAYDS